VLVCPDEPEYQLFKNPYHDLVFASCLQKRGILQLFKFTCLCLSNLNKYSCLKKSFASYLLCSAAEYYLRNGKLSFKIEKKQGDVKVKLQVKKLNNLLFKYSKGAGDFFSAFLFSSINAHRSERHCEV